MNNLTIKKSRKKLGLTQAELAELIGVSENTIYNYEKGSKIPQSKITILRNVFKEVNYENNFNKQINNFEEPSELYKNIDPEEVKTAISTFEAYLKTTNEQLKRLQEEPKTANNIREMKDLIKLQLDLRADLEELKR